MRKKVNQRLFFVFAFSIVFLVVASVFAAGQDNESAEDSSENGSDEGEGESGQAGSENQNSEDKVLTSEEVTQIGEIKGVSDTTKKFIEDFVKKKKINPEDINEVNDVPLDELPDDVSITNVEDSNIGIIQVDYNETHGSETKPEQLFVITYSTKDLESKGDLIFDREKRQFLHFGLAGESSDSSFLQSAAGVQTGADAGYVMMRAGSITGLSTNLQVVSPDEGRVEIVIFRNGEPVSFTNTLYTDETGSKVDYDVQSQGVIAFSPGDVISVYVNADDTGSSSIWKDVITMLEITTTD